MKNSGLIKKKIENSSLCCALLLCKREERIKMKWASFIKKYKFKKKKKKARGRVEWLHEWHMVTNSRQIFSHLSITSTLPRWSSFNISSNGKQTYILEHTRKSLSLINPPKWWKRRRRGRRSANGLDASSDFDTCTVDVSDSLPSTAL